MYTFAPFPTYARAIISPSPTAAAGDEHYLIANAKQLFDLHNLLPNKH